MKKMRIRLSRILIIETTVLTLYNLISEKYAKHPTGKEMIMLPIFHKKTTAAASYDRENLIPAIRASICTGEQVAGFCRKDNGKFEEVMLIRSDSDLNAFRQAYGIAGEIKKIY